MTDRRLDVGDMIEWQEAPVLVLGIVSRGHPSPLGGYDDIARCVYLRTNNKPRPGSAPVSAGDVKTKFHLYGKQLWTDPLTDEEEAMAMRMLLMGDYQ